MAAIDKNPALVPNLSATRPDRVVLIEAPIPDAVPTIPCAIKTSGTAGDIGNDQRGKYPEYRCADAVEGLNGQEKQRIADQSKA